jgi:glycosyltransferase involved in cell wall biosynthesis
LIREHECGVTYLHGDVDGLVDAVAQLARNPSLRASMSRRAERLYTERFVAERVYPDMAAHLEELAAVV